MNIDRKKIWWGIIGLVILVLGGLNFYLFLLRNSIFNFIAEEANLDNERINKVHQIRERRQ